MVLSALGLDIAENVSMKFTRLWGALQNAISIREQSNWILNKKKIPATCKKWLESSFDNTERKPTSSSEKVFKETG